MSSTRQGTCVVCKQETTIKCRGRCSSCYSKLRYRWNRERILQQKKEARAADPVKYRERDRKRRADFPDQVATANRNWREQNVSYRAVQRKRYCRDKKVELKGKAADRYQRNKEAHRIRLKKWRALNPDKVVAALQRRKARKLGAPICDFTAAQWTEMKKEFHGRCAYCGKKKKLTQDHVVPLSKGGSHTKSNIVPACARCNSRKGVTPAALFKGVNNGSGVRVHSGKA